MIYAIHPAGKLTVTPEGAYLRFHAEAPQAAGLLRLWLSGCGRCESLGLMEPRGGRLVLDRRLSRRELCRFPAQIERAELAEQQDQCRARSADAVAVEQVGRIGMQSEFDEQLVDLLGKSVFHGAAGV